MGHPEHEHYTYLAFRQRDGRAEDRPGSEVREECGYDAPLSNFRLVQSIPGDISIFGERMTILYAEVAEYTNLES